MLEQQERSLAVNHMVWCKRSPVFLRVNIKRPNIDKRDPCILMTVYIPLCKDTRYMANHCFYKDNNDLQCFQWTNQKKSFFSICSN